MSPMPRAARAPHSSKVPQQCPDCGSHVLTRRGSRKKKLEIVQLWRCASCKRTFTPGPEAIRNKTYPLRTVIDALSTYSLGYSLEDTVTRIKSKSGRTIGASTITGWLAPAHARLACHRPKLGFLRHGELDDKRSGDTRFAAVANFLEAVPLICPHALFHVEDRDRASQAHPDFADISRIVVNRKENIATRIAGLIIPAVGNNKLRHETLQRFMLTNDSVTV